MQSLKRGLATTLVASAVLAVVYGAPAASLTEAEAKASFLYNLALFVEWPPSGAEGQPLVIGSAGSNAVVTALRAVEGRIVNGRPVQVKTLRTGDDARKCQVLYVAELDSDGTAWLAQVEKAPVLTVGDDEEFLRAGGMVRVTFRNARLKFDIDVGRTDRGGLKISSKVLGMARVVRDGHVVRD